MQIRSVKDLGDFRGDIASNHACCCVVWLWRESSRPAMPAVTTLMHQGAMALMRRELGGYHPSAFTDGALVPQIPAGVCILVQHKER